MGEGGLGSRERRRRSLCKLGMRRCWLGTARTSCDTACKCLPEASCCPAASCLRSNAQLLSRRRKILQQPIGLEAKGVAHRNRLLPISLATVYECSLSTHVPSLISPRNSSCGRMPQPLLPSIELSSFTWNPNHSHPRPSQRVPARLRRNFDHTQALDYSP